MQKAIYAQVFQGPYKAVLMGRMKTNLEKIPSGMTWPFSLCSQYS
jgi:hypothetical protein